MLPHVVHAKVSQILLNHTGSTVQQLQPVGGGSINQCFKITTTGGASFFCKVNKAAALPGLFEKEKAGLEQLANLSTIKVPAVIDCTTEGDYQLLLLEWVESGAKTKGFWQTFGTQLAALHQCSHRQFGWMQDNYMGSVPQCNKWEENWTEFFIRQRLQPLLHLCQQKGLLSPAHQKGFENIFKKLPHIFSGDAQPSLLHGDLWSGNFLCNQQEQPVLIDPAVYYGHRSMDLAMTTLFGGFDPAFYQAYQYHFPLPTHYAEQVQVCNLYPLLIHLYLFGGGYLAPIQQTLHDFS